jgi:nucleobase:cation symporter-1, NCS1 family
VLRGGRLDIGGLYAPPERSPYGSVHPPALIAPGLGLVAGWSWQYGLVPMMQGPIARALGGTDFSWLSGGLVAGGLYWLLAARSRRG